MMLLKKVLKIFLCWTYRKEIILISSKQNFFCTFFKGIRIYNKEWRPWRIDVYPRKQFLLLIGHFAVHLKTLIEKKADILRWTAKKTKKFLVRGECRFFETKILPKWLLQWNRLKRHIRGCKELKYQYVFPFRIIKAMFNRWKLSLSQKLLGKIHS